VWSSRVLEKWLLEAVKPSLRS
jgi:hypothetical protein